MRRQPFRLYVAKPSERRAFNVLKLFSTGNVASKLSALEVPRVRPRGRGGSAAPRLLALRPAALGWAPAAAARGRRGGGGGAGGAGRGGAERPAAPPPPPPLKPGRPRPGQRPAAVGPGPAAAAPGRRRFGKEKGKNNLRGKKKSGGGGRGACLKASNCRGGWQAALPLSSPWEAMIELVSEIRLPRGKNAESRGFVPFSEQEGKWWILNAGYFQTPPPDPQYSYGSSMTSERETHGSGWHGPSPGPFRPCLHLFFMCYIITTTVSTATAV